VSSPQSLCSVRHANLLQPNAATIPSAIVGATAVEAEEGDRSGSGEMGDFQVVEESGMEVDLEEGQDQGTVFGLGQGQNVSTTTC
jgi:hypothetical protein